MRLRGSGLTPPQLVDEVLQRRIERVGRETGAVPVVRFHPDADGRFVVDALGRELRTTSRLLRVASVVCAGEGVLLVVVVGLRLLGA